MTIIDTTTVSVLLALLAFAIATGVAVIGYALVHTYGRPVVRLPRSAKPVMHGRFA
ncbi:MAG: hypothetical protein ABIO16_05975 [Nocardioides sp.]